MDQVREQQLDDPDRASATLEDHKRMLDKVREQQLDDPHRASLDFVRELKQDFHDHMSLVWLKGVHRKFTANSSIARFFPAKTRKTPTQ